MRLPQRLARIIDSFFGLTLPGSCLKKLKRYVPPTLLACVRNTLQKIRIHKTVTALLGPQYTVNPGLIEIDVTYGCFRSCQYCNRFIDIAPSSVEIAPEQIKKFISESIRTNRRWKRIFLSGGEPVLHPSIHEIVDLVLAYKKLSPSTEISLLTSKTKEFIVQRLPWLPPEVSIIESQKDTHPYTHYPITVALSDYPQYANADFTNACVVPQNCGIGFNAFGFYPCTTAAAIDRIFGFNKGKKELPPEEYTFLDELSCFCRLCGFFNRSLNLKDSVSPQWQKALQRYKEHPPSLTQY